MSLTSDEVRHIALLARVGMTEEDIELMRVQLSDILSHFRALQQLDTDGVEPTAHSVETNSVMRDDEPSAGLLMEDALSNAPRREGDYVRVRHVLE